MMILPLTTLILVFHNFLKLLDYILVFSFMTVSITLNRQNFTIPLISEQQDYSAWRSFTELLQIPPFQINIPKFCPTIIGQYFYNDIPLSIQTKPNKKHFKKDLFQLYLP